MTGVFKKEEIGGQTCILNEDSHLQAKEKGLESQQRAYLGVLCNLRQFSNPFCDSVLSSVKCGDVVTYLTELLCGLNE